MTKQVGWRDQNIILKIWANRGLFEDLLIGKLFTKSVTTKVWWSIKHVCYKMAWVAFIPRFNQQCEGALGKFATLPLDRLQDCWGLPQRKHSFTQLLRFSSWRSQDLLRGKVSGRWQTNQQTNSAKKGQSLKNQNPVSDTEADNSNYLTNGNGHIIFLNVY